MFETVDHPPHYKASNGMEVIDVIQSFELGFDLGNAVKYILRAGKKNDKVGEEISKAIWYLNHYLDANNLRLIKPFKEEEEA